MFTEPTVFGHEWAKAVGTAMSVIEIRAVDHAPPRQPVGSLDEEGEGRYTIALPTGTPRGVAGAVLRLQRHRAILRAFDDLTRRCGPIDATVVHFSDRARTPWAIRRWRSVPTLVIEHSTALTGENPTARPLDVIAPIVRRNLRDVAGVCFVTEMLLRSARALDVVPPGAVTAVIPNPIDSTVFHPPARPAPLDGRPVHLIAVARLAEVKQLHIAIRSVKVLQDRGIHCDLTVIGDGPERERLQAESERLRLTGSVKFLGHQPKTRIASELRAADVFLAPSAAENLPFAILEAAFCGLPIVTTNVGGIADALAGRVHRLVEPDPDALADAAVDLAGRRQVDMRNSEFSMESVGHAFAEFVARSTARATAARS